MQKLAANQRVIYGQEYTKAATAAAGALISIDTDDYKRGLAWFRAPVVVKGLLKLVCAITVAGAGVINGEDVIRSVVSTLSIDIPGYRFFPNVTGAALHTLAQFFWGSRWKHPSNMTTTGNYEVHVPIAFEPLPDIIELPSEHRMPLLDLVMTKRNIELRLGSSTLPVASGTSVTLGNVTAQLNLFIEEERERKVKSRIVWSEHELNSSMLMQAGLNLPGDIFYFNVIAPTAAAAGWASFSAKTLVTIPEVEYTNERRDVFVESYKLEHEARDMTNDVIIAAKSWPIFIPPRNAKLDNLLKPGGRMTLQFAEAPPTGSYALVGRWVEPNEEGAAAWTEMDVASLREEIKRRGYYDTPKGSKPVGELPPHFAGRLGVKLGVPPESK